MRLYDTLAGKKREFAPLRGNTVRIYTCGPSVYAYSHIGNFRTYLFEDVLVRYLKYKGYGVKRVMNITDVEDKAIAAAGAAGVSVWKMQRGNTKAFFSDWDGLGMLRPDVVAKASAHVPRMVSLIKRICACGYCRHERDGVYFDVRKFRGYGKLRHLKNPGYFGKAHGDDYSKEGLWDFRLWKRWTRGDGDVKWKSPFGEGRPGWHIECSAMSMHYLGDTFDIHCGGSDNIYPHHENEIAQGYAATGKLPANFWLHARHLTIEKRKMSKSTGNVLYVKDLGGMGVRPGCLRFYLISERYRMPLDFTVAKFRGKMRQCDAARETVGMLRGLALKREGISEKRAGAGKERKAENRLGRRIAERMLAGFEGAMDDDLNTKLAFSRIFRMLGEAKGMADSGKLAPRDAKEIVGAVERIDGVLRVLGCA
jgi:cysteinyl-tRNA synthetase